nr:WAS/WASL-interacting protein family member 1-like [Marmota flaviventris]
MELGGRGEERGRLGGPPSLLHPSYPPPTPQSLWPPGARGDWREGRRRAAGEGGREPAGPGRGAGAGGGGGGGGRRREEGGRRGGARRRRLYMGIGFRLQIQFITRKHRLGGGRVRPAGRPQAEALGPWARLARGGGLRPRLQGRTAPKGPCRRLPAPSFLPRGAVADRFSPPPRGLLLTLRKTPDVRGWLSATGGKGFPASPGLPAASLPGPSPQASPCPPNPRRPTPPLLSREHPPSQPAPGAGAVIPEREVLGFPSPAWLSVDTRGLAVEGPLVEASSACPPALARAPASMPKHLCGSPGRVGRVPGHTWKPPGGRGPLGVKGSTPSSVECAGPRSLETSPSQRSCRCRLRAPFTFSRPSHPEGRRCRHRHCARGLRPVPICYRPPPARAPPTTILFACDWHERAAALARLSHWLEYPVSPTLAHRPLRPPEKPSSYWESLRAGGGRGAPVLRLSVNRRRPSQEGGRRGRRGAG